MEPRILTDIRDELTDIKRQMLGAEQRFEQVCRNVPEEFRSSAQNLLHYLALRHQDHRHLQGLLAAFGLSSLGRAEGQALANVEAVLEIVRQLERCSAPAFDSAPVGQAAARAQLNAHTRALFGPTPEDRDVRVMVTMPSDAATDYTLVRDLVASGMDCMRINTAHDDPGAWDAMLRHLARAKQETSRNCRVSMDLAGPKLRTGPMEPGPPVVRWRPQRDVCGRVIKPARIWLTPRERSTPSPDPAAVALPVSGTWLAQLEIGDEIRLHDARDAKRELRIVERGEGGVWGESLHTAYILPGTSLRLRRHIHGPRQSCVGWLPPTSQAITLIPGDTLMLARDAVRGTPAVKGDDGVVLQPPVIGVSLPEIFDDVQPGEVIWFDDGRIGGVVKNVTPERIHVTITRANGTKLGADKGINLPDTNLRLPSLTAKDLEVLPFIAARADIVGYSFVRTEADVLELQARVAALGRTDLGLILKIETRRAFDRLPALLLTAMRSPATGVMIARGDLAVECGYERLAEVQEEILWLAEASHIPVIWATQVLEGLAKEGIPSRAEITDAAMGERAECVMLNKGPYIVDAVRALDNILTRMQAHQRKKSAMLRHLRLAERFLDN